MYVVFHLKDQNIPVTYPLISVLFSSEVGNTSDECNIYYLKVKTNSKLLERLIARVVDANIRGMSVALRTSALTLKTVF